MFPKKSCKCTMKITDIFSGHYAMQVVVESQTETNSISFPFENTVHDNIYAVIHWLASCFCFTTGHFYAISGTYLVSLSVHVLLGTLMNIAHNRIYICSNRVSMGQPTKMSNDKGLRDQILRHSETFISI